MSEETERIVREIRRDELDSILELYADMHDQDDPVPGRHTLEKVWREIISDKKIFLFGVDHGHGLISCCHLVIVPNLSRGSKPYGVLENVVTKKAYRGHGHGKAMVQYALERAWQSGCYKVMVLTGRKNEAVYRFYESVGFDRHGKQAFIARPR